jgi:hypothetical protein
VPAGAGPPEPWPAGEGVLVARQAGAGALEALAAGGGGRVLASFAQACYVEAPAGLVALVAPGVQPGPLHVHLGAAPPRLPAGTALPPGWLDLSGCRPWVGPLPPPPAVRAAREALVAALVPAAAGALVPAGRARVAQRCLEAGDLPGAAAVLAGAGPGLTPSGDDALAGILFAWRALGGPAVEPGLLAVAGEARTNDVAAAFARWAARGQALGCVHDLFAAAAAGDRPATARMARRLASTGHSSGADMALGLIWGFDTFADSGTAERLGGVYTGACHRAPGR